MGMCMGGWAEQTGERRLCPQGPVTAPASARPVSIAIIISFTEPNFLPGIGERFTFITHLRGSQPSGTGPVIGRRRKRRCREDKQVA